MKKILAIGIGIIALSLLTCSIGLVTLEDQDEEFTVVDAGNRSFKFSIPLPNVEGDAVHLIPSRSAIYYSTENAAIKKVNDCEWLIGANEEGRIYDVKKEEGKLIISTGGYPSELQEDLVLIKKLLILPIGAIHKDFMWLKPGETGETYYTFYTRNGGPGKVRYKIYSVARVGEKEEMAMPEGLNVSIEPSKFMAQPHENYTSKITVKTSPELADGITGREYILYLQAVFEDEEEIIGDNWLRTLVAPSPNPSEFQEEWILSKTPLTVPVGGLHKNVMLLKPGETGETCYTFYTRNGGLGEVSYKIYRVTRVGEKEEKLMPEGLNVSIEPSTFIAQSHKNYTSKIIVKTSPELLPHRVNVSPRIFPGRMFALYLQVNFEGENETIGDDWLRVEVSPSLTEGVGGFSYTKSITLKPGEKKETYYTVYTGDGGPGVVSYEIYRWEDVYKAEGKLPMPEGLRVSIEPTKFFAQPRQSYISKITIDTSPELSSGEYLLEMDVNFEPEGIHGCGSSYGTRLTVNVV